MPGKIFISCGQATEEERRIAADIKARLKGFDTYIAIETQSLQDVNNEIIGNLRSSDYYIFIDFAREQIRRKFFCREEYRGSLFTNQELAIAYILEFEHVIFLRESKVRLEGIGQYLLSNALTFNKKSEIPDIIEREVVKRSWSPSYTRHLIIENLIYAGCFTYGDHAGSYNHHIWHAEIKNHRTDIAAFNTVARLNEIVTLGGVKNYSPDQNFLKWAGKIRAYSATILPRDQGAFDLLAFDTSNCSHIYLHSEEDRPPRTPILTTQGNYVFKYQVFSQGFPLLEFDVGISSTGNLNTTTVDII